MFWCGRFSVLLDFGSHFGPTGGSLFGGPAGPFFLNVCVPFWGTRGQSVGQLVSGYVASASRIMP